MYFSLLKNLFFDKRSFSFKKIILIISLAFFGSGGFAQTGIIGAGFTSGWSNPGNILNFSASAGTSRIITRNPSGTGNQFFRLTRNNTTEMSPSAGCTPGGDLDISSNGSTVTGIGNAGNCTNGAWFINCPNTTDNYVFKTSADNSSANFVYFRVQGTIQTVSTVTQSPTTVATAGQTVTVTAALSAAFSAGQAVYLRYSNNSFSTSTVIQMTGSGTSYTGVIPSSANTSGSTVRYYVFTSGTANVAADGTNADFFTINLNNNAGSNYSYTVTTVASGNAPLGNSPYTQNFNGLGGGLPSAVGANWSAITGATASALGTVASFVTTATSWATSTGQFANVSSANSPATSVDNATTQSNQTDRAFSVKTTGSYGDPGQAFVFQIPSTVGLTAFNFSFKLMSLDSGAGRTQTWTVDYGIGVSPTTFTPVTTSPASLTTGPTFGSTNVTVTMPSAIDFQTGPIWIRVVSLSASTGSGTRPCAAIDDVSLSWSLPSPPTITSFTVAAPGAGTSGYVGNTVTVNGSNFFATGMTVRVGGVGGTNVSSYTFVNSSQITFPAPNASGAIYIDNSAAPAASFGNYTNLGYITQSGATNWNTPASWLGGAVPVTNAVTTIAHPLNLAAAFTNPTISSITVNTGVTATANATVAIGTVTNAITTIGTGVFTFTGASGSITAGSFINAGTLSWSAAATLNISASGTLTNNGTFTRGAGTVNIVNAATINGSNAITFNNLTLTSGTATFSTVPTIDGILSISSTSSVSAAPIYTSNSTLLYNGSYGRFNEWNATGIGTIGSTAGYPNNVTINTGTFDIVNSINLARAMNGNLLVNSGGSFNINALNATVTIGGNLTTSGTGAVNMGSTNQSLVVSGSVSIAATGALVLSSALFGDLFVAGNFTNNGTFTHNNRAVFLNGTTQAIAGSNLNTSGTTNCFDFLVLQNATTAALGAPVAIRTNLTFTSGRITLGTNNLTVNGSITSPTSTSYVNTNSTGRLVQNVGASDVFFPVGRSTYNPITLNNTGGTPDSYGVYVLDVTTTPVTNDATKLVNRYWNINEGSANGTNLNVTAQWNGASEQNANFAAGTTPKIALFSTAWADQTATLGTGTVGGSSTHATTAVFTPTNITAGATVGLGKDDAFIFPPPTVTNFTPTSGYTGTTVTITGTNFIGVTTVSFGGIAATSFVVVNATTITAVVGAGTSGSVAVTTSSTGTLAGFTYLGYISTADGAWSANGTWLGNAVPPNNSVITIANAVNLVGSNPTQTTITVNSTRSLNLNGGGSLVVTGAVTNNGTIAFSSSGNLTVASLTNSGSSTLSWTGGTATLNIANGGFLTNNGIFTRGTGTVNFVGGGNISGTIGFNNLTVNGNLNIGSATTINNNLTLNPSSFINTGNPTYATGSTLIYNSGGNYDRGNEWTGASSGQGFPSNVRISTVGTAFNMNAGTAFCGGNVVVDLSTTFNTAAVALNIGGSLAANGTFSLGGDVYISGLNWTIGASGTQTNNGRAVFFNAASGNQTITRTGGGNVFFDYLVINKAAGNVVIEAATNIVLNSTTGDMLQIINAGQLDLNGRSLALNNNGGNILVAGGVRNIIGGANSSLFINGSKTVTGSGTLVLGANVTTFLTNGIDFGSSKTTINGTLTINNGGAVNTNPPTYGNASTLIYNSGTTYGRNTEWSTTTGFGYPNNVTINVGTTLDVVNGANSYKRLAGTLTVLGTITINALTVGSSGIGIEALGNIVNDGFISFGASTSQRLKGVNFVNGNSNATAITTLAASTINGDLEITGTFTDNAVFNANGRAVWFTGTGDQTIAGTAAAPFNIDYIVLNKPSGVVRLNVDCTTGAPLTGNALVFSSATDFFDINGRTFTLGTNGTNSVISGNGFIRGSATSNLVINGTGAFGTINFDPSNPGTTNLLNNLTLNRTASGGFVLGRNVQVNGSLTLTDGTITLGSNNLTIGGSGTISVTTPSSTRMIIADGAGELRKVFTANGSFVFPIGDNTGTAEYAPATLNFTGGTYSSAFVGLRVTDTKHPNNIATTDFLTRFWSVTSSGISSPTYSFTGTYIGTASDISGIEANSKPGRWDGTDWLDESVTSISANTLSLTGLTTLPATNQFSAGAPLSDATYYYRSNVNGGSWNIAANWQSSPNGSTGWVTATTPPNSRATSIVIRNGFNINASTAITADDLTIDAGAALTISGNNFTLNNGAAATDLTVNGTLTYSGGTFTQNASSGIVFAANANYNHTASAASLTLPIATWNVSSNCNVTGLNNSSPISAGTTIGQTFGNFTFDNQNQTNFINIQNNNFRVNGTLTVGPNATSQSVSFTNTGSNSNTINRIVVSKGLLNAAGSGNETLTITNDVSVTDGFFVISGGSGTSNVDIGTDLSISGNGTVQVLGNASSPSQTLRIRRDLLISGLDPQLDLEAVSTSGSVAIITVDRDFDCSSTGTTYSAVDFGTGSATGNVINIGRNFTKSGNGSFFTTSSTSATGFAFNGVGTQNFSYGGTNSDYTSYVVRNNSILLLNSNLTLGIGTNPPSSFTVDNGGTLNFQTNSIIAGNTTDPRFIASAGANLITSNTNGLGGTTAASSLRSFGSVNSAAGAGRAAFEAGHNLTFNAATTTPFASTSNLNFGTPATVNVNADLTSNMTTSTIVTTAFNVNNGGVFKLNSGNTNSLNLSGTAALNIATGGTFDNGGENSVTNGGSITISGRFITQDVQGFVGTNTSIPTIVPVLNSGSTVEYGLAGSQAVQGLTAPTYQNITFSNGGIKTLASLNPVFGTISVLGTTIFDAGNNAFGSTTSNITMTGTSIYRLGGTTASKPESGGTYTLGAGTTFEFTGNSNTDIRLSNPIITFANIIINGENVNNPGTATGIRFQTNGTFTVKNGAVFKLKNTNGFTGSANTAINTVLNGGPTITLETGSRVEFAGDQTLPATQTITPFATYSDVGISGRATKVILANSEILVGRDLVLLPFSTPSQTGNLQIDNGKLLTVTRNILNTSTKDLVVMNGGNLVQLNNVDNATANANTGNILMTRTTRPLDYEDYVYWGSPVFDDVTSQIPALYDANYMWDLSGDEEGTWNIISATVPGRGFITRVGELGSGAQNFNFTGKPNNGTVSVEGLNWNGGTGATGNTILLGNPYPSAISASAFVAANTTLFGTLYFWTAITAMVNGEYDTGDYATWNATGTVAPNDSSGTFDLRPTGNIGAGQGFFAEMNASGTISFNNTMRLRTTADNMQFFRSASVERHRIWLKLTNSNNAYREALVGYVEGATNEIDRLYDGNSITGNEVNIYSIQDDKKLVIQGRALPFTNTDLVPLGYAITTAGDYTIAIDELDGLFSEGQSIYLEDLLLNVTHNLTDAAYSFTTESGTFENRFILRYTNTPLGTTEIDQLENKITVANEKQILKIKSTLDTIESVTIFDIVGRMVFDKKNINATEFYADNLVLNQQTLIVKITLSAGETVTRKIVY